jgi:hypothetical protein
MWVLKIESLDIYTVNRQRKKIQGKREKLSPRRHNHPQPEVAVPVIGVEVKAVGRTAAIPNSECSQRYKRLDVFTGKGFAMKIAN